ncbi:putative membrane protein [Modicisalibacter xianhensis]|uniref:Putative membrane protein n=1 Tax=Modicisalibacter xianhensis TaxID=442341 RepID=A0A4R8G4W1_9GAMM|nr:cytochrome c oxidase assembly protein [Halomonas xianhensis]TDX31669.1 putative membrane protein [Halomonas xianhensis]
MTRPRIAFMSLCLLAFALLGPLLDLARLSFGGHMALHMLIVAGVAPLLAMGLAGSRLDPARKAPKLFSPLLASVLEFLVIWAWHAPSLHHASRQSMLVFALELASYLAVGLLLWCAAFGGPHQKAHGRAATGIAGLLLTSMHMTLLGVLLALTDRPLYRHSGSAPWALTPLQDQQIGGVIMLGVGGAVYLLGGLYLLAGLLRSTPVTGANLPEKRHEG